MPTHIKKCCLVAMKSTFEDTFVDLHSQFKFGFNSLNFTFTTPPAKVVCGPKTLFSYVDPSHTQASMHLCSRALLRDRCKTIIVHFKVPKKSGSGGNGGSGTDCGVVSGGGGGGGGG